jgi:phage terminase small subunit
MTEVLPQPPETWGELGPAMQALTEIQRRFVRHYIVEVAIKPQGAPTRAAIAAGYKSKSRAAAGKLASDMLHEPTRNEKIIAAINEECRKYVRAGHPEAVAALFNVIRNPDHKDHVRAVSIVLDRTDPVVSHHDLNVTHRHIDPVREELEELAALRALGTAREKLLELYGGNGLARLERLEAAELEQRAVKAKLIEGEVIRE